MRCKEKVAACLDTQRVVETPDGLSDALVIRQPWLNLILAGKKTWEIRGRPTTKRCRILLAQSGTGKLMGSARIVDCKSIPLEDMPEFFENHRIPQSKFNIIQAYKTMFAWILTDAEIFDEPIPYKHPQGAVSWVVLPGPQV